VTGFGPFKSFHLNPSFLIASRLPTILLPKPSTSNNSTNALPPTIRLIVHQMPIRVSYPTVASLVPRLLAQYNPDYIFHIGMAGGRDFYALETLAHRDGYRIRDVDGRDGYIDGEARWRAGGGPDMCPEVLDCGWDVEDVQARWREELGLGIDDDEPRVKMSMDAGRFLCDFIFYESLSTRWKEQGDRVGKACFFHVPGETDDRNLQKGVRVAEAAIRSVVGSWEEGYRRMEERFTSKQEADIKEKKIVPVTSEGKVRLDLHA